MTSRQTDLALMGATGFVGRQTAARLAERAPAGARITLAGRDPDKLVRLRESLGERAATWDLATVDSFDDDGLARLAGQSTAVVSTVGPYRKFGMPLLAACARAGTHYGDLTAEVLFVRDAIAGFDAIAKESGARIVPSCGFDSIPSDICVFLLHRALGALGDTTYVATSVRGGFSGGTIDSLRGQLDEMRRDPRAWRIVADPYSLSPDRGHEVDLGRQPDFIAPTRDPMLGWLSPFVMAPYNTRVVRRSNALLSWGYGPRFRYREAMGTGSGATGLVRSLGLSGFMATLGGAMFVPPTRAVVDRILPKPGEGPSEETMVGGRVRVVVRTTAADGQLWRADLAAAGDPGYRATSLWLAESGLALAFDGPAGRLPDRRGFLTPATALGDVLVDRMRAAGTTLTVSPVAATSP
jgi:short subunit dehydrogenase-like uncharacterized protein